MCVSSGRKLGRVERAARKGPECVLIDRSGLFCRLQLGLIASHLFASRRDVGDSPAVRPPRPLQQGFSRSSPPEFHRFSSGSRDFFTADLDGNFAGRARARDEELRPLRG